MKTTIELPDDLLARAKIRAVHDRTTLKDMVIRGLELVVRSPGDAGGAALHQAQADRLLAALSSDNREPMTPLRRDEIHDRSLLH